MGSARYGGVKHATTRLQSAGESHTFPSGNPMDESGFEGSQENSTFREKSQTCWRKNYGSSGPVKGTLTASGY